MPTKCRSISRRCATRLEYLLRSLHPHHRADHHRASAGHVEGDGGQRRPLSRPLRGLVFGPRRGLLRRERADRRGGGREAVAPGHAGRMDRRGKLVLPPVGVSGPPARPLSPPIPTSSSPTAAATKCCASSRAGCATSASRAPASTGGSRSRAARPRDVRLARRADQLHDRGRLSRRRRGFRSLLAGRLPPDRQGRRPLPRRLLAGVPDVAPGLRCRSWSTATAILARARRENVEERRQCRRSDGDGGDATASMRCAISCSAKSASGRTAATATKRSSTASTAELANSFGNLAQRSLSMVFKNLDGVLPAAGEAAEDVALLAAVERGLRRAGDASSTASPSRPGSRRGWRRCSPAMPMSTRRRRGR